MTDTRVPLQYQEWLTKLTTIVTSDGWREDLPAQVELLCSLRDTALLDTTFKDRVWPIAMGTIGAVLDIPCERMLRLGLLVETEDIAKALLWRERFAPPDELFPATGWLADYRNYTSGNEVPTNWHFWTGLCVLAATLKRSVFIPRNLFEVYPNLYVMIVSPTASFKSTAINLGTDLLRRLNLRLIELGVPEDKHITIAPDKGTVEPFLNAIKAREVEVMIGEGDEARVFKRVKESTAYFGADDLVTLLSKHQFGAERWIELLTALWDKKGDFTEDTVKRGAVVLRNPAITFIGGTTYEWLTNNVTEGMMGGGFISRCIYAVDYTKSKELYPKPEAVDPLAAHDLVERLVGVAKMEKRPVVLSPGADAWHDKWYREFMPWARDTVRADVKLSAYYGRRPISLMKLAMLLAVSQGRFEISEEDMDLSNRILTREEGNLPETLVSFSPSREHANIEYVADYIKLHRKALHSDVLKRMQKRVGKSKNIVEVIKTLEEQGRVRSVRKPGAGGGVVYEWIADDEKELLRNRPNATGTSPGAAVASTASSPVPSSSQPQPPVSVDDQP